MARLSPRRGLVLLAAASLAVLVCLQQRELPWRPADAPDTGHVPPRPVVGDVTAGAGTPWSEESAAAAAAAALAEQPWARPWFMAGGSRWPQYDPASSARLWPHQAPDSDRITEQLMFVPPPSDEPPRIRKVLVYNGLGSWSPLRAGRDAFQHCPVSSCTITTNKAEASDADAILFKDHFVNPGVHRPARQVWILYFLECPYHTQHVKHNDVFNWTATYRRDSDIVAPYERWAYYDDRVRQKPHADFNYAANKTKKVAWFVSNCGARNKRLQYAHELQKHIQVDIYGACGTKKCPRSNANKCLEMLDRDYKFYLAFENSNCKDYITEKFYVNGLMRNVLPVVMGARPEDYARNAPERSYIHVDEFASAKELAAYLHQLDTDDELYNSYFRWKGTGEFINTYFFCRLCALLHDDFPAKAYRDINEWWRGPGTCTSGSWRKVTHE
ncbi:glycoprotein 3-alpha-L-fucosyltransferase A-like [Schistocerca gregaria]|uniref:glycoprotein 3-alpha-L-fucosyltransferase A-like n=1 Tax=Schistocerca gregaria TaxID=7010 RepID=UPI00211E7EB3|nr:glycoprotein 3-alpha-L-fucosyltransferase A-like [Schistocerca gregaria]XP_049844782.1 glycoprotein 3-alpha-L-fucosyltransferase A-like [Schistocerca gregaria]XP_049844783.1 glycoprotein 3-alpha-L-fucosyltransferase A-like [Schistocerca gregaria]XP_049844784.1 glycoprotein 3-alpha-L-fucosyltransferase A-like [Schistocerca gregaria]XP_049844785.1 glycoprotein 3-alpha-L-fucosyltransferase A-like [Schistocerca gregaria]